MSMRTKCSQYIRAIIAKHGLRYPYILFKSAYGRTLLQKEKESNLRYIIRCARKDYEESLKDNAVYQQMANNVRR